MAKKELSDEKLSSLLSQAINDSESYADGKLKQERREVRDYYDGSKPAPMHSGDSKYVSRDVYDSVDAMRSTVLENFLAHSRIVTFQPERGETVDDSKQATDWCRHTFFKDNDGEQILYDTLTDALQNRFSVNKVYPEIIEDVDEYDFEGLTPEELALEVQQYEDYEIDDYEYSESGLLSGTFSVTNTKERVVVEVIQPEDLLISSRAASLQDADYIIHRTEMSRSECIREYGKEALKGVTFSRDSAAEWDIEKHERFEDVGDMLQGGDSAIDESNESATVYEAYMLVDMFQEGTNDKWRIVYIDDVIVEKERINKFPFVSYVPIPRPHTFFGENFAQSVIPTQNARTVLVRQIINHSLTTNNPRHMVASGTVNNPKELTDNRHGGIVNVRRIDGIAPIPQQPLNPYVFNLIGMIDEDKEETTGISKLSQGMNKDAISTQNAEGMVESMVSNSQQRQRIIARRFGSYIRDLFFLIYHVSIDHISQATFVDSLGNYVDINPADWEERSAASVELTLSPTEQEKEAAKWVEIDQYIMSDPMLQRAYPYERRYEVLQRSLKGRGIEDVSSFLTPPDELDPPQPSKADKMEMAEQETRIAYQKAQTAAIYAKAETDKIKAQADAMKVRTNAAIEAKKYGLEVERFIHDVDMDEQEIELSKTADKSSANYSPDG